MGKRNRDKRSSAREAKPHGLGRVAVPAIFFLSQIIVLPGAASPFRTPKMALLVGGLALIVGFRTVAAWRRGTLVIANGDLALALLGLPALQMCSALWSAVPLRALHSGVISLVWVVAILYLARVSGEERRRALVATLAGATLSAVVMFCDAAGMHLLPVAGDALKLRQRLVGLAGNPADLAMTATLLLPLVLARDGGRDVTRRFMWSCAAVLIIAIILSQTLTAFAAVAVLGMIWVATHRSRRVLASLAGAAVVIGAALLLWTTSDRFEAAARRLERGNWYSLLSARFDGWSAAAQMIEDAPILGQGAGHFGSAFYASRLAWLRTHDQVGRRGELATHFSWAHCDPLQLAAEMGLVGVGWMIWLAWGLLRSRQRGDPMLLLAAAAALPFLLLHYPSHVAAGVLPLALILAELVAGEPAELRPPTRPAWFRGAVSLLLVAGACATAWWQLRVVTVDLWRGGMESALLSARSADQEQQLKIASFVEARTSEMIRARGQQDPQMWSLLGRARLAHGNAAGAEQAFRTSFALQPHEEAEFGIGLSLAAQGKRSQALIHLGRVCRVNRSLVQLIDDEDLARTVRAMTRARVDRGKGGSDTDE